MFLNSWQQAGAVVCVGAGQGCRRGQVPGARGPDRELGRVPGGVGDLDFIHFVSCPMLYPGVVAFPHHDGMIFGPGRKGDVPWVSAPPGVADDGAGGSVSYSR